MEATARQTPIGAAATHYAIALVALALLALLIWLMLRNRPPR
jgi:heme A synthase